MTLKQASGVGTQIPEFGHLNTSFESEYTFDAGEGVAIALEEPETEQFVVKADEDVGLMNLETRLQG